jgi:hypothetical protein
MLRPSRIERQTAVGGIARRLALHANLTTALKNSNDYPWENGGKSCFLAKAVGTARTDVPA